MIVSIIAALTKNRIIGKQGKIPWHLPEDMAHFKNTTMGHSIIMGRKTFDSLGKPLSGRKNIVITHNASWKQEGVQTANSLEQALSFCQNEKEVFIIGGAEIYTQAYSRADRLIFTFIEEDFEGDTFFPNFPFEKDFKIVSESRILFSLKENLPYRFVTMERKTIKENL